MAFQIADRVKETTTTTGTGTLSLAGAITGYRAFSSIMATGDTCFYALSAVNGSGVPSGVWEVGIGTYTSSGNTLARTTILSSSNAGAAVTLPTGTAQVWIDVPASQFKAPVFSAYQSTAQTLATGTITKIQLQTKEFDPTSAFDNTTNFRFQPAVAGYYALSAQFAINSSATQLVAYIYKNGVAYKEGINVLNAGAGGVSCLVFLNGSTDYVEFWAMAGAGQALAPGAASNWFQGSFVRGAY